MALPSVGTDRAPVVSKWIFDSGCGHDLIAQYAVQDFPEIVSHSPSSITFSTANGNTRADKKAEFVVPEIAERVSPWILNQTPAVLSMGLRCMVKRCDFVWPAGREPYIVTKNKKIVRLLVTGNIPYLVPDAPRCQPIDPGPEHCIPSLPGFTMDCALPGAEDVDDGDDDPDDGNMPYWQRVYITSPPLMQREARLRKAAKEVPHILHHKPFNPHCEICIQCNLRELPHRRGDGESKASVFGELVTLDYLVKDPAGRGVGGYINALNFRDLGTGSKLCFSDGISRRRRVSQGIQGLRWILLREGDQASLLGHGEVAHSGLQRAWYLSPAISTWTSRYEQSC